MKKSIIIGVALLMAVSVHAGTISWNSADFSAYGLNDGWLVALYEDVDANGFNATSIDFSTGATDSDDVYLGVTTVMTMGKTGEIFFGDVFSAPSGSLVLGDSIATVIFNSSALDGSATMAWYSTAFTGGLSANAGGQAVLPGTDVDATYTVTGIAAVPEPATFLMFALGGFGAWMIRRKNRSFLNK